MAGGFLRRGKEPPMKKKLWILCVIAVLLSAFGLGLTAAYVTSDYSTEEFSYDQIKGSNADPHPQSARFINIFYEGDFPGMSDFPITAEQAEPGKKALNALRGQTYTRLFPLIRPSKKGIGIHEVSGCTPSYTAYWDGKHLWLPNEGRWRGYAPSSPDDIEQELQSSLQLQNGIKNDK